MTFYDEIERFQNLNLADMMEGFTPIQMEHILAKPEIRWQEFLGLLSPSAHSLLENMTQAAHKLTIKHFGRTILLYTPLYLSNYCVNQCVYCGFNQANDIPRRKLTLHEVELEAQVISGTGLQHLLILTGESRQHSPVSYIADCLSVLRKYFSSISIEVYPLSTAEYAELISAGVDGLTIYQEVYDQQIYRRLHPAGPKRDYSFRLAAPERAGVAGIRTINIGKETKAYDTTEKEWRHLNFFQYACYLVVRVPRIDCPTDGIHQIELPWARDGADFTFLFESFAMTLVREMPVNKVSKIIKVDDNKLWRMMYYYTEAARQLEDYAGVNKLGVDETSKTKGHNYVSLFVDLAEKRTIFVAEGKGSETMTAFSQDFKAHQGNPDAITEVSMDMSPAFIRGVEENLHNAKITFDKYHILKIINTAVDEVRKNEAKQQDLLRGQKYLFLRNRQNLTESQLKALQSIESMSKLNLKTVKAYHIRENFQEIYKEETKEGFEKSLKKWYFWATHSRIAEMKETAKTIKRHWSGVLHWYDSRINNGILEGLNSLVQATKAKARGYRTFKNLKTMIYILTGKLDYSKVGLPT